LSTDKAFENSGNATKVYVDYPNITKVVKPGNRVYVDDGLISLIVKEIGKNIKPMIYNYNSIVTMIIKFFR